MIKRNTFYNTTINDLKYKISYYNIYQYFRYKSRDEFVNDVRLIFDNCEKFNYTNSPVGQAGHGMRKYFELRWAELTNK